MPWPFPLKDEETAKKTLLYLLAGKFSACRLTIAIFLMSIPKEAGALPITRECLPDSILELPLWAWVVMILMFITCLVTLNAIIKHRK